VSQVCSGRASVVNHQKWSRQIESIAQINNIKNSIQKVSGLVIEPFASSEIVAKPPVTSVHNLSYQICLDDTIPDSIKKDNDLIMSCPDRVCAECGNDHSFRGNFEGVITSIDLIPELLYGQKSQKAKEVA
jgi:hypothetical protein